MFPKMYALEDRHFHFFPHIFLLHNLPFSLKDSPQRKGHRDLVPRDLLSLSSRTLLSSPMRTPILCYPVVNCLLMP